MSSTSSPFTRRTYAAIRAIPHGHIASYGGIAAIVGRPRAARAVGTALRNLPENSDVPWWRVVNRNGEISIKGTIHGPRLQRALLAGEGVKFDRAGRIDWKRFGWDGSGVPDGVREEVEDGTGDGTGRPVSRERARKSGGAAGTSRSRKGPTRRGR